MFTIQEITFVFIDSQRELQKAKLVPAVRNGEANPNLHLLLSAQPTLSFG